MTDYDTRPPVTLPIAKAHLERNPMMDGFDVFVVTQRTPDAVHLMLPLVPPVIQSVPTGEHVTRRPAFLLDRYSAQALFDGMWEAGLRSSAASATTAANEAILAAMQNHIDSLRHVVGIKPLAPDEPASQMQGAGSF